MYGFVHNKPWSRYNKMASRREGGDEGSPSAVEKETEVYLMGRF